MLSREAALSNAIKLVRGADAARDRIAVSNALLAVQAETARECALLVAGRITGDGCDACRAAELIIRDIRAYFGVIASVQSRVDPLENKPSGAQGGQNES